MQTVHNIGILQGTV